MNNIKTSELVNYELQSSNSNNYSTTPTSSSPESIPSLMEENIIVQITEQQFDSELIEIGDRN